VKFYGAVGYAESQETTPGVWTDVITEKNYSGEVIRDQRRLESSGEVNEDIRIDNSFSIVADAYATNNIVKMRYVMWNGNPWTITNVEVRRPRLILQIGAQWDGKTA
jgi:hypothetical protein